MSPEKEEQSGAGMAAIQEISCVRCGAAIKPGKKFCSQCGSPVAVVPSAPPPKRLRRPNICPECSFENHHSDLFCKGCGAQLGDLPRGVEAGDSAREGPNPPPAADRLKTDITVPPVTSHEAPDARADVVGPPAMQASSTTAPEEPQEALNTDTAGLQALSDQSPDSGRPDWERESGLAANTAPSQTAADGSAAAQDIADSEVAKPRRPSSRAVGVALGVGLGVLVALVHFHRPAKVNAKQFSVSATTLVAPLPGRELAVARSDSVNQPLRSANFKSAEGHGQSRADLVQPSRALSQKRLKNALSEHGKKADAPRLTAKLTPAASAPALTSANAGAKPSELASPLSTPVTGHTETANGVPSVSQEKSALPAEVSRQTPATLPSSAPPSLPAEINPGPVSPDGPASPANTAETVHTVQPAKLLSRPALSYPPLALEAHVGGDVHLEANVRADGTVVSVRVVRGNVMLNDAAVDLVQHSRYQPALVDGRPVRSYVDVVITFRLPH